MTEEVSVESASFRLRGVSPLAQLLLHPAPGLVPGHRSKEGWLGFRVAEIRCGMIMTARACAPRLEKRVRLSVFAVPDGRQESGEPLIRIHGDPLAGRWSAVVRLRWDANQLAVADVSDLLAQLGAWFGLPTASYRYGQGHFEMVAA